MLWRTAKFNTTILFILLACLLAGCAVGGPTPLQEDMMRESGFWTTEANTPKSEQLMQKSPKGMFSSYEVGGQMYYVYPDPDAHILFVGDEAAYQKYVSMQKKKQLCQSLDVEGGAALRDCISEYQKSH